MACPDFAKAVGDNADKILRGAETISGGVAALNEGVNEFAEKVAAVPDALESAGQEVNSAMEDAGSKLGDGLDTVKTGLEKIGTSTGTVASSATNISTALNNISAAGSDLGEAARGATGTYTDITSEVTAALEEAGVGTAGIDINSLAATINGYAHTAQTDAISSTAANKGDAVDSKWSYNVSRRDSEPHRKSCHSVQSAAGENRQISKTPPRDFPGQKDAMRVRLTQRQTPCRKNSARM